MKLQIERSPFRDHHRNSTRYADLLRIGCCSLIKKENVMKKIWFVLLALVLVFLMAGCAAQPTAFAQSLIGLPEDGKTLVLALVTAGLAWLLLKVNMGQFTQPLAAAIAPIVVLVLENVLGMIPSSFDNIVLAVLHWLVLFISGSMGAFLLFKRSKAPRSLLA
jgi:hypothetical protein